MHRLVTIIIILNFYNPVFASSKGSIISQMKLTKNLSFDFIQTIDEKNEKGKCIIKYPKKLYCKYTSSNKKIIVSNGKFLVIKIRNNGNYYIYPLKKTPLNLLLDKKFLISKIINIEPKIIDDKYLYFQIFENNNEIGIFFDKNSFFLTGWQTEDIYQTLNVTFISSVKVNQIISDEIFILPKKD